MRTILILTVIVLYILYCNATDATNDMKSTVYVKEYIKVTSIISSFINNNSLLINTRDRLSNSLFLKSLVIIHYQVYHQLHHVELI